MKTKKSFYLFVLSIFILIGLSIPIISEGKLSYEVSELGVISADAVDSLNQVTNKIKSDLGENYFYSIFGGEWLDNDLKAHIAFTIDSEYLQKVTKDYNVVTKIVKYSESEIYEELSRLNTYYNTQDTIIYYDVINNSIQMDTSSYYKSISDFDLKPFVSVNLKNSSSYIPEASLTGGSKFVLGSSSCSVGYRAYKNGKIGFVTAGHCGVTNVNAIYSGSIVGKSVILSTTGNADAMFIQNNSGHSTTNTVYSGALYSNIDTTGTSYKVGSYITKYGLSSNTSCYILSMSLSVNNLTDQVRDDCSSTGPGWSGGTVMTPIRSGVGFRNEVIGSHVGKLTDGTYNGIFTKSKNAINKLGLTK